MEYSAAHEVAIGNQVRAVQKMWLENFGATFPAGNPVVRVVRGDRDQYWYLNNPSGGNCRFYRLQNMATEVMQKLGYRWDTPVRVIVFPASKHDGHSGGQTGITDGFQGAFMDEDDIQCAIDGGVTHPYDSAIFARLAAWGTLRTNSDVCCLTLFSSSFRSRVSKKDRAMSDMCTDYVLFLLWPDRI